MKISVHEPMPYSAVSFYRSIGVFSHLNKLRSDITISIPKSINWNELIDTDLLYMERPHAESDVTVFNMARQFNIPVWVDFDDLLHDIPPYNPSYNNYMNNQKVLKSVEGLIQYAQVVTVSTQAIKEYYSKFNPNIIVLPNAHNDYRFPFNKVTDQIMQINWRGSNTHREDLLSVKDQIIASETAYPAWRWSFVGNDVWFITNYMRNAFNLKECDIIDYFTFIQGLKASIQVVPLLDNAFNRAKSNISYIEGVYAGSVNIVPDFPEFDRPGALKYKDPAHFGYLVEKAIKSKEFRQENYLKSFEYVRDNLLLSNVNKQRLEIIENLL